MDASDLRRRRRILLGGALAVIVLAAVGAPWFVARVEADLESRVPAELAAAGFDGVIAEFSGQDGTLSCAVPLDEPEDALDLAAGIDGVRRVELDRSCRVSRAPSVDGSGTSGSEASGDTGADFDSVLEAVDEDPRLRVFAGVVRATPAAELLRDADPITLFAPTDDAFDALTADELATLRSDDAAAQALVEHITIAERLASATLAERADADGLAMATAIDGAELQIEVDDGQIFVEGVEVLGTDVQAVNGVVHATGQLVLPPSLRPSDDGAADAMLTATLTDGRLVLTGPVADAGQRALLVIAAESDLDTGSVDDLLAIDPEAAVSDEVVRAMAQVVAVMPTNLVTATVSVTEDGEVVVEGVHVGTAAESRVRAAADSVGAASTLSPRPVADAAAAAELQGELNGFVDANPILFETGSARLSPDGLSTLDQVAGLAKRLDGVVVTIEGYTDSDGTQAANQTLSEDRADAVRLSLAVRGVPTTQLVSIGFGETDPIVRGGVEDKDASRRVEFRVEVVEEADATAGEG